LSSQISRLSEIKQQYHVLLLFYYLRRILWY
jgi:hypothetical protein